MRSIARPWISRYNSALTNGLALIGCLIAIWCIPDMPHYEVNGAKSWFFSVGGIGLWPYINVVMPEPLPNWHEGVAIHSDSYVALGPVSVEVSSLMSLACHATVTIVLVAFYCVAIRRHAEHCATHCLHCGYDLHMNRSNRCPECGAATAAALHSGMPRARMLLATAAGAWLQLAAIGALNSGHDGSLLMLFAFFGPFATLMPLSFMSGFLAHPFYIYVQSRARRPRLAAGILICIHLVSVAAYVMIAGYLGQSVRAIAAHNWSQITSLARTAPVMAVLSATALLATVAVFGSCIKRQRIIGMRESKR